jgi:hypothetical protein
MDPEVIHERWDMFDLFRAHRLRRACSSKCEKSVIQRPNPNLSHAQLSFVIQRRDAVRGFRLTPYP